MHENEPYHTIQEVKKVEYLRKRRHKRLIISTALL